MKPYDKPIAIEKINPDTEIWEPLYQLHARINKSNRDSEYLKAGASRNKVAFVFDVRYSKRIRDICNDTQSYRIKYNGITYNIKDYDNYMMLNKSIRLLGESY